MPVIIVSADQYEDGRTIAQKVAEKLACPYLGRELLTDLAREKGLPKEKLIKAIEEPPRLLTRRTLTQVLQSHIQTACLERLRVDEIVCQGLGAHMYVNGISHVLKVRIVAHREQCIADICREQGLSLKKAEKRLEHRQAIQRHWSMEYFGVDQTDAGLYDLAISLKTLKPDKAVEIICDTAGYREFRPMTYSRQCLEDKYLASLVRDHLMDHLPEIRVEADKGTVAVYLKALKRDQRKKQDQVRELSAGIPGVSHLEVHFIQDYFAQAAISDR